MFGFPDADGWLLSPEGEAGETGGAGADGADTGTGGDRMVPVSELSKVRKQYQEARDKLAQIQADQEAARQAAAEEQGKFQELWKAEQAKREALEGRVSAYEDAEAKRIEALKDRNAQRIAALPEGVTVPDADPQTRAALLDALEAMAKTQAATAQAGATGRAGANTGPGADELTGPEKAWVETDPQGRKFRNAGAATIKKAFKKLGPKD